MAGSKRPEGLKTREAILEVARQLFLRQGYHATGMRQIAHECGISLSAVYNHFPSKEKILEEILSERNIYAAMTEALSRARGESVAELMESGYVEIMAALRDKADFMLLVFIDVLEFQGRHVAKLAGGALPRILDFIQRLTLLGHQRGELRDISPLLLGRAYIQLIFSSFILENVVKLFAYEQLGLLLSIDQWGKGLTDILLHGVLKPPSLQEVER